MAIMSSVLQTNTSVGVTRRDYFVGSSLTMPNTHLILNKYLSTHDPFNLDIERSLIESYSQQNLEKTKSSMKNKLTMFSN